MNWKMEFGVRVFESVAIYHSYGAKTICPIYCYEYITTLW